MSRRALIAISAGTALAAIAISLGAYVVLADGPLSRGTGDFIAYSCKERKNVWYAVCVMKVDGSEKRRLTDRLTTTDPAWSPDGRQIAFTRNEDVGEATTTGPPPGPAPPAVLRVVDGLVGRLPQLPEQDRGQ